MGTGEVTCDGLASHPGGVAILLVTFCHRDKFLSLWATLSLPPTLRGVYHLVSSTGAELLGHLFGQCLTS